MIVVDAGAVFELVVGRGFEGPVAEVLQDQGRDVFAPEILDLEVVQALRSVSRTGSLAADRAASAAAALHELPIERVGHRLLLERVWELRHVCSAYDASYVALAECFGGDGGLLTTDRRLVRTVEQLGSLIDVTVVPID